MADDTHRLEVPVRPDRREDVTLALWMMGASGTWEQPERIVAWFDAPPDTSAHAAAVPELLGDGVTLTIEPDRDWQAAWKATIAPIRAGRFTVVPTWLATTHTAPADGCTIVLDPGRAFGTGHHATTALCLELLDDLDRERGLRDRTLADVGCGSGILAIAAAARGAGVQAVDVDPDAVAVTRENAAANGVRLQATTGSTGEVVGPVDIVVANLISDVVRDLAGELVALTRGELLVSGITLQRRDDVLAALTAAGAEVVQVSERDGWIAARLRPSPRTRTTRTTSVSEQDRTRRTPASTSATGSTGSTEPTGPTGPTGPAARGSAHTVALLLAGAALTGLAVAGCTTPQVEQPAEVDQDAQPADAEPDPQSRALAAELDRTVELVERARGHLDAGDGADTLDAAHAALQSADELLVATPGSEEPALLPIEDAERTAARSGRDALTELLTQAREAGGQLGRGVVEVLRDPIAGDLGAWELDAPGVVETARAAGAAADDAQDADTRIVALDGEASRAIAWIAFGRDSTDLATARDAAQRADGHLEVIVLVLDGLAASTGPDDAGEGDELGPVPEAPQDAG